MAAPTVNLEDGLPGPATDETPADRAIEDPRLSGAQGQEQEAEDDSASDEAVTDRGGSGPGQSTGGSAAERRLLESPITFDKSRLPQNRVYELQDGLFVPNRMIWNVKAGMPIPEQVEVHIDVNQNGKAENVTNREKIAPPNEVIAVEIAPIELDSDSDFLGLDTFYVLEWNDPQKNEEMVLVSPVFTVVSSQEDLLTVSQRLLDRTGSNIHLESGYVPEITTHILPPGSLYDPADPDTTGLHISPMSTQTVVPLANDFNEPKTVSDGLATSAKIGIAVACAVVGISIILLIAFFLIRRRRKRRSGDHARSFTYDASPHGAVNDYVADKETNGARIAESPYTDDGRGSALLVAQDQDRSFAAYSDGPPHAITADTRIESRQEVRTATPTQVPPPTTTQDPAPAENAQSAAAAQGNRQIPTAVAHLVEEGMTEDQIRRLEEEERALDRAIEQAGHGDR